MPSQHSALAVENIATVSELGLLGAADDAVLSAAVAQGRVVLTHDADFGTLAMVARRPIVGIAYFRPGHIRAEFTLRSIDAVVAAAAELTPPFVLVAQRRDDLVSIRTRSPLP